MNVHNEAALFCVYEITLIVVISYCLNLGYCWFQEYEIDKKLGIKGPDDVKKLGIANYNAECRKIVSRYSNEWEVCRNDIYSQ